MKKIILILLLIIVEVFCVFFGCGWEWKRQYTKEELEQGLQRVEIIYIIDSDSGWVHDVIYTFTKDEEQEILEEITKIEFLRSQPHSSAGHYALKFCYDEFSLMIAPTIIVKLDSNN